MSTPTWPIPQLMEEKCPEHHPRALGTEDFGRRAPPTLARNPPPEAEGKSPILVLFDLDETLYARMGRRTPQKQRRAADDAVAAGSLRRLVIRPRDAAIARPGLERLLAGVAQLKNVLIGIYTSCQAYTVRCLLRPDPAALFPPQPDEPPLTVAELPGPPQGADYKHPRLSRSAQELLFVVLSRRDNAPDLGEGTRPWDTQRSFSHATAVANAHIANIRGRWEDVFSERNVLLVDNEARKVRSCPANSVVVDSFTGVETDDCELGRVLELLQELDRELPADVRPWLAEHWQTAESQRAAADAEDRPAAPSAGASRSTPTDTGSKN